MALFNNPARSLILPTLLLVSLPLAIFACITTTLAIAVLLFRVAIIYIELAVIVIPHYFLGSKSVTPISRPSTSSSGIGQGSPVRRKKRQSSTSNFSPTDTTQLLKSQSGLGISQSIGPARDYEGLGGWRLDEPSDDEGLWTSFNSRLELPADRARKHRRSLTSGSLPLISTLNRSHSEEMTMNTSRVRTPSRDAASGPGEGCSPLEMRIPRKTKRTSPVMTSASMSSGSSKGSSVVTMKK